ncbi:Gfo/Idh/MocA family protein [Brachyspira pilosicoli]|uniref:Gfo/Idh/MocA family oxidoreductase n=1 Tax=Brachyspira pilosicoli TaxID=52584 RepID=A0A5C8FBK9_BRAPL|nr:Gfo/Idh/MocA family oxidoreductase [Brachyspira pilosicoli]TXJ46471.1 Gfo/Idh/MocA family oxidoreductase [Brachyspira pilosicoli]
MKKINIGFIGAGSIAKKMAKTIAKIKDVESYAVSARDIKRSKLFAKEYGFKKFYGSYEEMVKDENVDLVYIATPHSHHYEHIKLCLNNNKNVLCEKAFTVNTKQARDVILLAKKKKLLLAEAICTRYMPSREIINETIKSGIIGKVSSLTANLGYVVNKKERLIEPELAGGALLDVGVYTINFALMVFGNKIKKIDSTCVKTKKGVDEQNSITLTFDDGKMAVLNSTMSALTNREGVINGDKGYIVVKNINNPESITVYSLDRKIIKTIKIPKQISGYEYEVISCADAIRNKKLECKEMPHEDIIRVMNIMDTLRRSWKIKYPCEK